MLCLLADVAQAASLRVSAEPPLSGERLGDALRSYLDSAEIRIEPPPGSAEGINPQPQEPGSVVVTLRKARWSGGDAEVVLVDGEETILARLPGALRTEDLYRTAALKVQSLLQRRLSAAPSGMSVQTKSSGTPSRVGLLLDIDIAMMVPTQGPSREALRLGLGLRLAQRWHLGLGAYLEPRQSADTQGIHVTSWELPVYLSLGYAWHTGIWQGFAEIAGHGAIRRFSAEAPGIVSDSDTTLSPRAGGVLGVALGIAPGLRAEMRVSGLAVLADARYRVDGQVVWPAASALVLFEMGLEYGGH
jgi:hypothetical protein